jgi:hypothetical protein
LAGNPWKSRAADENPAQRLCTALPYASGQDHGRDALRPNLNSILLFAIAAQLTMPSGGLASEPGEVPVRMDQEQVSGEIEILAGEFTGREFSIGLRCLR